MIKSDDPIKIWEQDGDLERVCEFWDSLTEERKKEQIKQMALAKLLAEAQQAAIQQEDFQNEHHSFGPLADTGIAATGAAKGRGKWPEILRVKSKQRLQGMWRRWQWKVALPVAALALVIAISQIGVLPNLFGAAKSENAADYKSAEMAGDMGMAASDGELKSFNSGESQDQVTVTLGSANYHSIVGSENIAKTPSPEAPPADEGLPRKITYKLYASVQVDDVQSAVDRLQVLAQSAGGYVVDSQINNQENNAYAHITLKIPAAEFAGVKDRLVEIGKVLSQHLQANDISDQYYDAEARLRNYEAQEARYLEILQEADTVEDVLQVENALSNVRMQIEQLKGELKLWDHQVAYSTIEVELRTKHSPVTVDNPWQPITLSETWEACQRAVLKSISTIWNAFNYLIVGIGYALPAILGLGGGYLVYRQWRKKKAME